MLCLGYFISKGFDMLVPVTETSWHAVRPGSILRALQLLFARINVTRITLDENSITHFVEELDGRNAAMVGISGKATSTFT